MRASLLVNPRLLLERLAVESVRRRRLARLKRTAGADLGLGHIDSLELLEMLVPRPAVIYDIGANRGTWTLLAKSVFPASEVHAFEPLEEHCRQFEAAAASLPGVRLHRVALGSKPGDAAMNVASFSDASSLLEPARASAAEFGVTKTSTATVQVHRLDEYRRDLALPPPDLIKLDVQGFELEALAGGEEALAAAAAVIMEVSFVELYVGQPPFSEVIAWMGARGFEVAALGVNTALGRALVQTDVLLRRAAPEGRTTHPSTRPGAA